MEQYVERCCEMNYLLSYMPCLKHHKKLPYTMCELCKFLPIEVCTNVLVAAPAWLSTYYYVFNQNKCAVDLEVSTRRLVHAQ